MLKRKQEEFSIIGNQDYTRLMAQEIHVPLQFNINVMAPTTVDYHKSTSDIKARMTIHWFVSGQ